MHSPVTAADSANLVSKGWTTSRYLKPFCAKSATKSFAKGFSKSLFIKIACFANTQAFHIQPVRNHHTTQWLTLHIYTNSLVQSRESVVTQYFLHATKRKTEFQQWLWQLQQFTTDWEIQLEHRQKLSKWILIKNTEHQR